MPLRGQGRAFERVDGDVHLGATTADFFTDVQHRSLILLTLTNHNFAADRAGLQGVAHRIDGGAVGRNLVAPTEPAGGGDGTSLSDTSQIESKRGRERFRHGWILARPRPEWGLKWSTVRV